MIIDIFCLCKQNIRVQKYFSISIKRLSCDWSMNKSVTCIYTDGIVYHSNLFFINKL
jgi:hypothetical protein